MKRTQEAVRVSFVAQEKDARDTAILRLNECLSDREERELMGVLPQVNFGRLVYANMERMCWTHPLDVFDAAGVSPVRMNTEALRAFIAAEPSPVLRNLYTALFVDAIQFVPWRAFLDRFGSVVIETVESIKRKRDVTRPRRLTLLALPRRGVVKSNAWLVGFAWPMLAHVVDYVVSDWRAVDRLVEALGDPSFEIDVLYVDDMIYSGRQAQGILMGLGMKSAERTHIHIVAPFVATKGRDWLTMFAKGHKAAGLHLVPSVVIVAPYRDLVRPTIKQVRREHRDILPPAIEEMLLNFLQEDKPIVFFEHKVADSESLPEFALITDLHGVGLPPLVQPVPEGSEFYKSARMRWHMYKEGESEDVRDFLTIDARLFAALLAAPFSSV
jgi:hypothetical protein